jgi:hypothetical protein
VDRARMGSTCLLRAKAGCLLSLSQNRSSFSLLSYYTGPALTSQ